MLIEKINAILPLYHSISFQLFPIFSPNVHITTAEKGIIMITFSMHSVVNFCSPFTVSQMPQPPITSDKGFIHRLQFNRVRNRISEVTKARKNSFRKKHTFLELLIPCHHGNLPAFTSMYWPIRIQIEKHCEEGKKERKSKRLIQSNQDVCNDLSE